MKGDVRGAGTNAELPFAIIVSVPQMETGMHGAPVSMAR